MQDLLPGQLVRTANGAFVGVAAVVTIVGTPTDLWDVRGQRVAGGQPVQDVDHWRPARDVVGAERQRPIGVLCMYGVVLEDPSQSLEVGFADADGSGSMQCAPFFSNIVDENSLLQRGVYSNARLAGMFGTAGWPRPLWVGATIVDGVVNAYGSVAFVVSSPPAAGGGGGLPCVLCAGTATTHMQSHGCARLETAFVRVTVRKCESRCDPTELAHALFDDDDAWGMFVAKQHAYGIMPGEPDLPAKQSLADDVVKEIRARAGLCRLCARTSHMGSRGDDRVTTMMGACGVIQGVMSDLALRPWTDPAAPCVAACQLLTAAYGGWRVAAARAGESHASRELALIAKVAAGEMLRPAGLVHRALERVPPPPTLGLNRIVSPRPGVFRGGFGAFGSPAGGGGGGPAPAASGAASSASGELDAGGGGGAESDSDESSPGSYADYSALQPEERDEGDQVEDLHAVAKTKTKTKTKMY